MRKFMSPLITQCPFYNFIKFPTSHVSQSKTSHYFFEKLASSDLKLISKDISMLSCHKSPMKKIYYSQVRRERGWRLSTF